MLSTIFNVLLPVFAAIFIGWISGKRGMIPISHSKHLANFIMTYSLPALMFNFTAELDPAILFNRDIVMSFIWGLSIIYLLTFLFYKFVLKHDSKVGGLASLTSSYPNFAFVGIPILVGLYGESSLIPIIVSTVVATLLLVPVTLIILESGEDKGGNRVLETCQKIIQAFLNPVLLAPIVGVIVSFIGIPIPRGVLAASNLIGDVAPGLSLFTMGLTMSGFSMAISREVVLMVFIKSIVAPIVMFFVTISLGIKGILSSEIIILGSLPTATLASMFSTKYDLYSIESSNATVIGTLFSAVSIGVLIVLLT